MCVPIPLPSNPTRFIPGTPNCSAEFGPTSQVGGHLVRPRPVAERRFGTQEASAPECQGSAELLALVDGGPSPGESIGS